jgi:hypothetical protein
VSVYVALTADASSSRASMANASRGDQESRADSSSTRKSHTRVMSSRRSHQERPGDVGASCRRSVLHAGGLKR